MVGPASHGLVGVVMHCRYAGTRKQDVVVTIKPERLTVLLNWHGRVLDGPLKKRVKAGDACWSIDATHVNIGGIKANSLRLRTAQQAASAVTTHAENAADGKGKGSGDRSADSSSSEGDSSKEVHASDMCAVELSGASESEMSELLVILPKEEEGRYWRALFEGGEEKSHIQVTTSRAEIMVWIYGCPQVLPQMLHMPALLVSSCMHAARLTLHDAYLHALQIPQEAMLTMMLVMPPLPKGGTPITLHCQ